jgi:hypothetical protein
MTKKRRSPSEEEFFWRAVEMAVGSSLPEDIADIGRYVGSRGDAAVAAFAAHLGQVMTWLRGSGVIDVLRKGATTVDGRSIVDLLPSDVDRCLEALVLGGRRYVEAVLADPHWIGDADGLPLVDLGSVVEATVAEIGEAVPLWMERPGDRRRDSQPWIVTYLAQGVGLGGPEAHPWSAPWFVSRYQKVALLRSLDDDWRDWRDAIGINRLDVWIEYCSPEKEPERSAVTDRRRTAAVTVYRDAARLQMADEPVAIAEREATLVLEIVRAALAPDRDVQ